MPPKGRPSSKKNSKVAPSSDVEHDQDVDETPPPTQAPRSQRPKPVVESDSKDVRVPNPVKKKAHKVLKPKSPEPEYLSVKSDSGEEDAPANIAYESDWDTLDHRGDESFDEAEVEEVREAEEDDGTLSGASDSDEGLVDGDSMYQEPPVPEKVRFAKRPAPETPPLDTRASSRLSSAQRTPQASPTKRGRYISPPTSDIEPPTPSKRSRVPKEKGKEVPVVKTPKMVIAAKTVPKKAKLDSDEQLDFERLTLLEKNDGKNPHLQDLTVLRVTELLGVCKVASVDNQDPFLKGVGAYKNLPNLNVVHVESLRQSPKVGLINYEKWKDFMKDFPEFIARRTLLFVKDGHFVNLSRVDPRRLTAHKLWGGSRLEIRDLFNMPVVALTPVMVIDSYVKEMNTSLPFSGNYFTGIMHSEEWARFISVIGMVTHHKSLHMQIWGDAITFATKGQSTINGNTGGHSHNNLPDVPGMFNVSASPSRAAGGPHMRLVDIAPLEYGHAIPVYDARGIKFDYNAQVFSNIDAYFPLYKGEIPRGSFVVAAHLTQVQKVTEQFRIVLYPVWALLIATP